jgi:hypothetical protein
MNDISQGPDWCVARTIPVVVRPGDQGHFEVAMTCVGKLEANIPINRS